MIYTYSLNSSYSAAASCFDSCSNKKLIIFSSSSSSSSPTSRLSGSLFRRFRSCLLCSKARNDAEVRSCGLELGLWVSLGYLSEALGLVTSDAGRASFISLFTIGNLFNFVSAIFFGIHALRTEQISRTTRKENIFALLGYEVGVVAILSTLWCLIRSSDDGLSLSWDLMLEFPWIPALYTGVFSTGLCLWGENPSYFWAWSMCWNDTF
ncbi:uncharacterized protein LOC121805306 isoform X2 [Salvia splendens]|uniref:uncharacterized protein LOC121805306 isoform X2 n=1 Tax=Salvia splendens TaxID=180675 RepID=UPI001C26AA2E|nr:uncharacterized protein LOC121805306 isoform X2 [Salvia splendens]XP_042061047.1 uncharacterized protein LOC121805306 isoform X2 [Salvia splendens]